MNGMLWRTRGTSIDDGKAAKPQLTVFDMVDKLRPLREGGKVVYVDIRLKPKMHGCPFKTPREMMAGYEYKNWSDGKKGQEYWIVLEGDEADRFYKAYEAHLKKLEVREQVDGLISRVDAAQARGNSWLSTVLARRRPEAPREASKTTPDSIEYALYMLAGKHIRTEKGEHTDGEPFVRLTLRNSGGVEDAVRRVQATKYNDCIQIIEPGMPKGPKEAGTVVVAMRGNTLTETFAQQLKAFQTRSGPTP